MRDKLKNNGVTKGFLIRTFCFNSVVIFITMLCGVDAPLIWILACVYGFLYGFIVDDIVMKYWHKYHD